MATWIRLRTGRVLFGVLALLLTTSCDERRAVTGGMDPAPSAPTPIPTPPASPPPTTPVPSVATYTGVVREPGAGPLEGVRVSGAGAAVYTDASGAFAVTGAIKNVLIFDKPGYRTATWPPYGEPKVQALEPIEVRMQRTYTLVEGTSMTGTIFPDDPEYSEELFNMFWESGYFCRPCRYVSVSPTLPGGSVIRLRWSGDVALDLMGGEYYGIEPITAKGVPGTSELIATFPSWQKVDVLLVGPGRTNGQARSASGPVDFTLDVEPRASSVAQPAGR